MILPAAERRELRTTFATPSAGTPVPLLPAPPYQPDAPPASEAALAAPNSLPQPVMRGLPSLSPSKNDDRERLLKALRSGAPAVLLHGRAGTGKTSLVHSLKDEALHHAVIAPTGIAALSAGGQTIHSFFRMPWKIVNLEDIESNPRLGSILRKIDLIVIDEISMVRADLLDVIDTTLRVHLDSDRPFGGIKILLVGDFLQLPPIVDDDDARILRDRGYEVTHAFGAKCIQNLRELEIIELSTVYRQSDPEFLELLHNLRNGEDLENTVRRLNLLCYRAHRTSSKPVILTSRIEAALEYNRLGLARLPGSAIRFVGTIENNFRVLKDKLPAPEYLNLKKGARIMMVKNDPEKRWVNGSLGIVSKLSSSAVWVCLDGSAREEEVHKATWESVEYQYDKITQRVNPIVVGTYTQFPIAPAWAITVHKAQGLTLDDVRIDLGHGAFSTGQAYVALSRATTIEGLSFGRPLKVSDVMANANLVEGVQRLASRRQGTQ
ncbi:MAG: AAA family ATPase [Acidobacteriaceae bacterium]